MTGRVGSLQYSSLTRYFVILLTLILLPLRAARATDWPPLDPNDLKITSLPQQPGAPAFVLLREELTDDPMNYHQVYKRMKILTDAGKRYADVEIQYGRRTFRVGDVSG